MDGFVCLLHQSQQKVLNQCIPLNSRTNSVIAPQHTYSGVKNSFKIPNSK